MTQEFVTGLPSVRQIQSLIRDRQEIEVKLLSGDVIIGRVTWQDTDCLALETPQEGRRQVWKHAIAFLKYP